jgi:deoxycytidine triphosphate deaminase
MILGTDVSKNFIEGLCERDAKNPEGAGFDIRVGEIFKNNSSGFLGIENRKTPDVESVAKFGEDKEYVMKPGEYILIKTMEKLNLPQSVVALTFPRSTLHRSGILLLATKADPGYRGDLIFGLKNLGDQDFRLELGARVAHVLFFEVKGETSNYRGQWQGGRVTTEKEERQV